MGLQRLGDDVVNEQQKKRKRLIMLITLSSHSWGRKLPIRQAKSPLTWQATLELHLTAALFRTFQVPLGFLGAACIVGLLCSRHLKCREHRVDGRGQPTFTYAISSKVFTSRLKEQQYRRHMRKKFMGSKHSPSDNLEPQSLTLTRQVLPQHESHYTG